LHNNNNKIKKLYINSVKKYRKKKINLFNILINQNIKLIKKK